MTHSLAESPETPLPTPKARTFYRAGLGLTLFSSLALIWLSLGVGIIGSDGARINVVYAAVLLVGLAGAFVAKLQPAGMARALVAMALTQGAICAIAVLAGWGSASSPPAELLGLNGGFAGLFLASAWLFRRSAA